MSWEIIYLLKALKMQGMAQITRKRSLSLRTASSVTQVKRQCLKKAVPYEKTSGYTLFIG